MIVFPKSPSEIQDRIAAVREAQARLQPELTRIVEILSSWGKRLVSSPIAAQAGVVFLCHWLRKANLMSLLNREIGNEGIHGIWRDHGSIRVKRVPVGVVSHWPAANVPIQPILSMTCAALGGNASVVRVPQGLEELTAASIRLLSEVDVERLISDRLGVVAFPSNRHDLQEAMARDVDGALIWGGEEAVLSVRSLPFPHWTRFSVFGPRNSVAVLDRAAWTKSDSRRQWCKRLARDVWQFEQRACSSPQVLFVERDPQSSTEELLRDLESAFREENRLHPRTELAPFYTSAIARARATWLLEDDSRQARFPETPDWTILVGNGPQYPHPVQNRCLVVQLVDDLRDPIRQFGGDIQSVGLGCGDISVEQAVVNEALHRRVDRITWIGRMHVFDSPWDGMELVAPMTRLVRYTPISSEVAVA